MIADTRNGNNLNSDLKTNAIIGHAILPDYTTPLTRDDDDEGVNIYFDWPVFGIYFSAHNIQTFESFLSVYPQAQFKILLPTPKNTNIVYNPYTKNSDFLLSESHFIKYQRRNYNIQIINVGKMNFGNTLHKGQKYWAKHVSKCCDEQSTSLEINKIQPYHVLTFIRLSQMWRKGGIFSDFSFFLLAPIDAPTIYQVRKCYNYLYDMILFIGVIIYIYTIYQVQ